MGMHVKTLAHQKSGHLQISMDLSATVTAPFRIKQRQQREISFRCGQTAQQGNGQQSLSFK